MKKLLLLLMLFGQYSFAQTEIVGSKDYGQILHLNYDPLVRGKMYGTTLGNHIVVSKNGGAEWEVLYSFPSVGFKKFQQLKIHNANELSFSIADGYSNCNTIYILNINTARVTRQYNIPITRDSDEGTITSYDFYDENTIIAINHYGIGGSPRAKVYYTTNRGDSWDMIYYNLEHETIFPNAVYISPNDPSKLFIARMGGYDPAHVGGLYISEDAGQNWAEKLRDVDFGPMAFHPNNPDDILLGTWYASNTQNLYRSSDGGESWVTVDENWASNVGSVGIFEIKYNPTDHNNIIVLCTSDIVRTFDNFQTKEVFFFENDIENPDNYFFGTKASFNPFNSSEIIITNNDYPLISRNGGETLSKIDNPFFFSQIGQLHLFKNDNNKHLYYSVQNGFIHQNLNTQDQVPYNVLPLQFYPMTINRFYADKNHNARLYGYFESISFGGGSGLAVSDNHGADFIGLALPHKYMHTITSAPNDPNTLFCSLSDDHDSGKLFRFDITDPVSIQQTEITLPTHGVVRDIIFDTNNPNLIWIAIGSYMYKTFDNGTTWELQNNGLDPLAVGDKIYQISQNTFNTNQLTIATSKGVFTSMDNGTNWSQLSREEVQSVKHSDTNNNHLVAITYDTQFTAFTLHYSADSGENWQQIPIEDLLYINCDQKSAAVDFINDTAEVYIGTHDLGVLKYIIDFNTLSNPIIRSNNFALYPNPSDSMVYVLSSDNTNNLDLYLYDTLGKKIKEAQDTNSIDLQDIQTGIYLLKIHSASGNNIETHRVVKK